MKNKAENIIAELGRYHRTLRELIAPSEVTNYTDLLELVNEQIRYYNFERYHSSIGYVTPHNKDNGDDEIILKSKEQKLQHAKNRRIQINMERMNAKTTIKQQKAA